MIEIKCQAADMLPIDAIVEFQGGLKRRGKKEIDQIIKSIKQFGFSFPFMVWQHGGQNFCLDGHGRIQALCEMRMRGEALPCFPVVYVDAKDEEEAKQKLLRLNSQYGQMTINSVMEFIGEIDVEFGDLALPKDIIDFSANENQEMERESIEIKSKYEIVVSFDSENDMGEFYNEMNERGMKCRVLTL